MNYLKGKMKRVIAGALSLLMLAGELLLAFVPGLLLCLAVKKIYGRIEEVTSQ